MKFQMLARLLEAVTQRLVALEKRKPEPGEPGKDAVPVDEEALAARVLAQVVIPEPPAPPSAAEIAAHVAIPELKLPSAAEIAALVPVPRAPLAPTAKAVAALVPRAKKGDDGPPGPPGPKPDHRWVGTKLQFEKPDGSWGDKVDLQGKPGKNGKGGGGGGVYVGGGEGGVQIDDSVESLEKTWSSAKIREEIDAVPGGPGGAVSSVNGRTGAVELGKADVGLDKVQNLSPAEMPVSDDAAAALADLQGQLDALPDNIATTTNVSTAQAAAVAAAKSYTDGEVDAAVLEAKVYTDTAVAALVDTAPGTLDTLNELAAALGDDPNFATTITNLVAAKEGAIAAGTTGQYWRGDKTWQTLNKAAVGLPDVENYSAAAMPLSTAATNALVGKEPTISAGTTSQYWKGNKSWSDFATDVRAAALTGVSFVTNAAITASDTVLSAFGKLQAQITAILAALPQTGDFKFVQRTAAPSGWVVGNGGTIGSASSGATRADPDTQNLFNAWWAEYTDAQLPILTSAGAASTRGASAAVDWAANKRLTVFDMRDRVPRGAGTIQANGTKLEATTASNNTSDGSGVTGVIPLLNQGFGNTDGASTLPAGNYGTWPLSGGTGASPGLSAVKMRVASLGMLPCYKL